MTDSDTPPGHTGPENALVRSLVTVARWVLIQVITGVAVVLLFWVFNRTIVIGGRHVFREPGTLFLSNHQTMIDSFLVGYSALYPRSIFRPRLVPWQAAAQENFFSNWFLASLSHLYHCIPVRKGRRDVGVIHRATEVLSRNNLHLFPEGTRSRTGKIGRGRPGAGMVALAARPTVIPVTILGMDSVLPIGSVLPRFGKTIRIRFGRPLQYDDLVVAGRDTGAARELVDRAMDRIRFQRRAMERFANRQTR